VSVPLRKTTMAAFLAALPMILVASQASAEGLTPIANANVKKTGVAVPTVLSPELVQIERARGAMPVENPADSAAYYGYLNNQPNMLPALGSNVEASKTEPDKNTYLVLPEQSGPDTNYNYGTHFLFQGHELGAGYLTRVNLDADAAHRVTVLATREEDNTTLLPTIDGSTWYPWAGRLLFTAEGNGSTSGGVWQSTPDFPAKVENLLGIMGRGGYEGIQADADGNIWLVEDIGGSTKETNAKVPNSFVYRFIPKHKADLSKGGKLQALQVMKLDGSGPIVFNGDTALTQDVADLHTYGKVLDTKWVTIHDTDVDGTTPFNANQLAKDKLATPFKRPENGQFRPGSHFREFFFAETGDTSAASAANANHGGFGGAFKLAQSDPSANAGKLTLFFKGDLEHTAFDNVAFWDEYHLVFVEDRGDGLHAASALDSGWSFDVRQNYGNSANKPVRIIAQGRDASATIDSGLQGTKLPDGTNFQNDGDNEITGIHVSDGDPGVGGLLGAKIPEPFHDGWRVFYTQQHGDNITYEIVPARVRHARDDDERD
jgi:uncharacterized protein DUF839